MTLLCYPVNSLSGTEVEQGGTEVEQLLRLSAFGHQIGHQWLER
jgi:hypothetical protein